MDHPRIARSMIFFAIALLGQQLHGQTTEESRLTAANAVLTAFVSDPATAIPPLILQQAKGIAIVPEVLRGGFIFGARRGKGIAIVRTADGGWSNPTFITLTGGSFGAQIGAESADVILVFGSDRSVRNISEGKFTVGGDAAATVGPIGRNTTATRDMTFAADLYTYVRSRGFFAGATIEGSRINIDHSANQNFFIPGSQAQALSPTSQATHIPTRQLLSTLERAVSMSRNTPPTTDREEQPEAAVTYPLGGSTN
jgi:lipid-binding SYLF domain-containing protein